MIKRGDIIEYLEPHIEQVLYEIESKMTLDEAKSALREYLKTLSELLWDPRLPRIMIPWGVFKFAHGKLKVSRVNMKGKSRPDYEVVTEKYEDWVGPIEAREKEVDKGIADSSWFRKATLEKYKLKMHNYYHTKYLYQHKKNKLFNE